MSKRLSLGAAVRDSIAQSRRKSSQRTMRMDLTRGQSKGNMNMARKSLYHMLAPGEHGAGGEGGSQVVQVIVRELNSRKASNTTTFVKFEEYVEFWRLMADPNEAADFAAGLVRLIVTVLKGIQKSKNLSFLCNLVHTLHYVDLMFTFDGEKKDALQAQIDLFEAEQVGHQFTKGSELALNVVQGIKRRHFGKAGFIADTLQESVMVNDASASDPVFDHLDLDLDFPYTFFYLRRLVRTKHADDIYRQIQRLLETYPTQTLLMSPQRIQKVCLKLLFLLVEFLAVRPPEDLAILKQMKITVKTFYFWPRPFGTFSKKILEVLDSEIQTPGSFAYARIASQNPFTGLPAFDLLQALGPMHLRKRARLQRTVWLYSDSNDVRANLAVNLMNLDSEARTTAESRARDHAFDARTLCLQIDIILSVVTRDLRVLPFVDAPTIPPTDELRRRLLRLHTSDPPAITKLLSSLQLILFDTHLFIENQSLIFYTLERCKKIRQALVAVLPGARLEARENPTSADGHARPPFDPSEASATGDRVPIPFCPPIRIEWHEFKSCEVVVNDGTQYGPQILLSNLNADSTQHSDPALFRHALDESSLRAVITDAMENMALFEAHASPKGARSPSAQTASGFKGAETGPQPPRIQKQTSTSKSYVHRRANARDRGIDGSIAFDSPKDDHRLPLHFCVVGNDSTLHRFLGAYIYLLQQYPALVDMVQPRVYLIPSQTRCNHVATYLARKDEWYRKQVFAPFLKQCIMPALLLEQETIEAYDEAAADADCAADEVEGDLLETTHLSGAAGESSREHLSLQRSDIASSVTAAAAAAGTPTETLFRIPMQFRQTLVQDYVRGAHYNTHFQVYECACWVAADNKGPPDLVVPFCSRAEIGLSAQCAELVRLQQHKLRADKKKKKKDPEAQRLKAEVAALDQLKKKWKHTFPKLKLQYAQTEAFSAVRGWVYQTQGEDYASITLRSVPDQTDLTPSDLPAREALELEQVKFSKEFKDRFRPKQGLRGLAEYARQNGEVVQTASAEISCADPSEHFKIMLDGVLYGPFHGVIIEPCVEATASERPITISVKSFIPTQ
eukprot:INCI17244.1.p1 GENE.INCI17244.1~~INCI17244.1.p1  ORF type:complete len:1116 (-),score=186.30 INCI17244.1:62-3289(-)